MNQKRKILVYIFDGFADYEVSNILIRIRRSNQYKIKTISTDRALVKSMSGLSIMPDLDFIPHVDLADIETLNTAMLILPSGSSWKQKHGIEVLSLLNHCVERGIPVAMMEDRMLSNVISTFRKDVNNQINASLVTLSKEILDVLSIDTIEVARDRDAQLI